MTIATDSVDPEWIQQPHRWDIRFIRRFMFVFGLVNSACDYLTFAFLLLVLHANAITFRTGWFIENVVTAALIVLVIRTRKPFYKSRPSIYLLLATVAVSLAVIALPYTPLAAVCGITPIPLAFMAALGAILVFYLVATEIAKKLFYARVAG